ncbi:guanine nucleotide-binding protein subunit gamma 3 isoform X2 [Ziziphus jujuba]|uniref:Guanine nucleotide-binding protein subunit gamma 3 isoform X2 n=1 Tax=Ziziphus jujuba TaxID=326968 RepID=A0ABM3I6Q5_ZIZJJ|nr:guanine nucleotide-binding protein subunit gamma 3 isoform X2 [Ziziphus jujuba]
MEGRCNSSSSLSSASSFGSCSALRAAIPKSPPPPPPPPGLDLYGKRRQMVKLQVLEREIGLLQEELKSLDGLQPASRSCRELDTFIGAKQDPFIAKNQDGRKSHHFWNRIWGKCRFNLAWVCCFGGCLPHRCACNPSSNSKFHGSNCRCLKKTLHLNCCSFPRLSYPSFGCCCFKLCPCKCKKVSFCPNCCCNPCRLFDGCTCYWII